MSLAQRLADLLSTAGISANELDRLAARPRGSAWLLIDRGADLRCKHALAYADVFGISLDWLIAGRGAAPIGADVRTAVERAKEANAKGRAKAKRSGRAKAPARARARAKGRQRAPAAAAA